MSLASRPLRFIVAVMAVWAGARSYAVWPERVDSAAQQLVFALPRLKTIQQVLPRQFIPRAFRQGVRYISSSVEIMLDPPVAALDLPATRTLPVEPLTPAQRSRPIFAMLATGDGSYGSLPADAPADVPAPGRFSGYAWLFQRGGTTPSLATDGQLGGGQAGIRLDYALTNNLAATGRFSMPTGMPGGKEAAVGLSWQPSQSVPVRLTVERRISIDRGRNAFAAFAAGGVGPVDMPGGLKLDAYAQGGVVGAKRRDLFVDGSATLTRPLAARGDTRVLIGGGVWGAAQPGVSRLDIGPRARVTTRLGGAQVGASLDYRYRIAGNAAPKSGFALTLDGGF